MISHKIVKSVSILHGRNAANCLAVVHNALRCVFEHLPTPIPSKCVNYSHEVEVLAVRRNYTSLLLFEKGFLRSGPLMKQ